MERRIGETRERVAAAIGCDPRTVFRWVVRSGGLRSRDRRRSSFRLSLAEREEIGLGLARGESATGHGCVLQDRVRTPELGVLIAQALELSRSSLVSRSRRRPESASACGTHCRSAAIWTPRSRATCAIGRSTRSKGRRRARAAPRRTSLVWPSVEHLLPPRQSLASEPHEQRHEFGQTLYDHQPLICPRRGAH